MEKETIFRINNQSPEPGFLGEALKETFYELTGEELSFQEKDQDKSHIGSVSPITEKKMN